MSLQLACKRQGCTTSATYLFDGKRNLRRRASRDGWRWTPDYGTRCPQHAADGLRKMRRSFFVVVAALFALALLLLILWGR